MPSSRSRESNRVLRAAVLDYCKTQRQWRRSERIANARYMLATEGLSGQFAVDFWSEVLRRNGAK